MTDTAQLIGLISAIVSTGAGTVIAQIYRENRNHRWEEQRRSQDKADAKEERERVARELAAKVLTDSAAVAAERQRIAEDLAAKVKTEAAAVASKVTNEAATLAAKVAAEANFARARGYHIQEAIAQVGAKADAAFDVGNHVAEKFDKVHEHIIDLNTQLVKQGDAAAAADKAPLKVEVVNTPLLTTIEPKP